MLSNSRILAQTTQGTNTVILSQSDSAYMLVLGTFILAKSKNIFSNKTTKTFKILAQKVISREEALSALEQIQKISRTKSVETPFLLSAGTPTVTEGSILLLETSKANYAVKQTTKKYTPVVSPYFSTLEVFLTTQMTCAPNLSSE